MSINLPVKNAGEKLLASEVQGARRDLLNLGADGLPNSTGSANAYVLTLDAQIDDYVAGMVLRFISNHSNSGASTININAIGVKDVKTDKGNSLVGGELLEGRVAHIIYNGTEFRILPHYPKVQFGGDGSDGDKIITSGSENIDLGGEEVVALNFTKLTIASGATLTFSNPHSAGTTLIIRCLGDVDISGTLDCRGIGASSGTQGNYSAINHKSTVASVGALGGISGNGADGASGTAGVIFTDTEKLWLPTEKNKLYRKSIFYQSMCGQTSGTAGGTGGVGALVNAGGAGGTAGADGESSGLVFLECAGALDFSGTINVAGKDGADGTDGTVGGSNTTHAGGGGGGGGGGGAGGNGGYAIVIYNHLTANTGTINSAGGSGGKGGAGGRGGAGKASGSLGGTAGGGGGGGGGAGTSGTILTAGRGGVGGKGGWYTVNNNDGRGGTGGSGGSGGAGGGSFFGGQGAAGTIGTIGAVGSTDRPSPGGAGGNGGAGGAGVASIGGLVVENMYF